MSTIDMQEMTITIRYDSTSIFGSQNPEEAGIDEYRTYAAYEAAVEEAVRAVYPHADITIIGPEPYAGIGVSTAQWITCDGETFWDEDDRTTEHVAQIVNDVYQSGSFWVEA